MTDLSNEPLRVLIADDEEMARTRAARLVTATAGAVVVGQCADGSEVLAFLETTDVDVILLDINMPHVSGLDVKGLLEDGSPHVIFVTAHPEFALKAFEVGAVDYVLKPLDATRLDKALARTAARVRTAASAPTEVLPRLPVESKGDIRLIDPLQITHATFDGQLVTLFTPQERLLIDWTLRELEGRLPSPPFDRVHRRALVNLLTVKRLEPNGVGGYVAHLEGDRRVDIARQAARRLRRRLGIR